MAPTAAPPSPQEIRRKLSVHSAAKPKENISANLSGNESDSDSVFTPETLILSPGLSSSSVGGPIGASSGQPPLTAIIERRDGSDSEEEDEEEEGGWKTSTTNKPLAGPGSKDEVVKTGYLWKKGERRKTWKKRWFVLRTQHLAYYKTAAEYQLLRLLELSDVHSCTQVSLKRHENTFGLVSPVRTFYLQAKTSKEVQEWVAAIEQARLSLLATNATNRPVATPITIPPPLAAASSITPLTPSPPSSFPPPIQTATSSDSEDASPTRANYGSPHSANLAAPPSPTRPSLKDPGKIVLSGYLMKCASKRRNWRKRWFVLTGEKLVYSASHMDTKPHRQFPFTDILDALEYDLPDKPSAYPPASPPAAPLSENDEPQGQQHTFKIVTTKRTLLLCAPGEEDEIKWLGAIRALIARRSGAGVVPGDASKSGSQLGGNGSSTSPPGSSLQATSPTADSSAPSPGFTSGGGSGGLKAKVRRLSASTGSALSGVAEAGPGSGAQEKTTA